jgi:hypothetical protein
MHEHLIKRVIKRVIKCVMMQGMSALKIVEFAQVLTDAKKSDI